MLSTAATDQVVPSDWPEVTAGDRLVIVQENRSPGTSEGGTNWVGGVHATVDALQPSVSARDQSRVLRTVPRRIDHAPG